jgi:hypothetical protein
MNALKIKFESKRLRHNLIFGIFFVGLGFSYFVLDANPILSGYLYSICGLIFIFQYVYDVKHQYLLITNGLIKKNKLYGWKNNIQIDEITEIVGTDAHYILKSPTQQVKINPSLIEKQSLLELIQFLRELDLPSNKNLFKKDYFKAKAL